MQVQRITPIIDVDTAGNVHWQNAPLLYDPALFYSGKKITNEVFNDLFVKQTSHGNYTSDTLKQFLTTHLPNAIFRQVQNRFKFTEHYTRLFNSTDWKGPDSNGYYYIDIPATEHGVYVADGENMQATVRVEMYALDSSGSFYNIKQFDIDNDNGVRLYTDDTSLIGYVIVALSNKAYAVVNQGKIDVSQIEGLSPVALSGNYSDLNGVPDEDVTTLANAIAGLKNGTITAGKAKVAEDAEHILTTTTFAGIPFTDIFETGSSYVKNATTADNYSEEGAIAQRLNAIDSNITAILQGPQVVHSAQHATSAGRADNANHAAVAEYTPENVEQTIEERLINLSNRVDNLGFKEGSIKVSSELIGDVTSNKITRQGNYCRFSFNINITASTERTKLTDKAVNIGKIDNAELYPNATYWCYCRIHYQISGTGTTGVTYGTVSIDSDGWVDLGAEKGVYSGGLDTYRATKITIYSYGYEAPPITGKEE